MLLLGLAVLTACGDRPPRVPTGDPLEVVRAAPDLTEQVGRVTVFVDRPGESVSAQLELRRGQTPRYLRDRSGILDRTDIRERARAALDLARRATEAEAYGGQQVRGVSTMRYEVTVPGGWEADVWIDVGGRVRRVQFADGATPQSPDPTQPNGLPALVTVDFVFPQAQRAG